MQMKSARVARWLVVQWLVLMAVLMAVGCAGTVRPPRSADTSESSAGEPGSAEPAGSAFAERAEEAETRVPEARPSAAPEAAAAAPEAAAGSWEGAAAPPEAPAARPEVARSGAASEAAPSARATSEPARRERPGLGTEWGETRASHVHDVSFLRTIPDHPFAVAQLFYNDREGVEALAAYHGGGEPHPLGVSAADGLITVYVVDKEWGQPLDAMRVGSRTYVVGEEGHRYSIVIANGTSHRYEAVATVDGLDVISGRSGSYENRGYLVAPWATIEIDGFRQSEDAVAAFRFSKVSESYAAQRGRARNVGVIGVAFFAERGDEWSYDELRTRDTARPFPREGRFAAPPW
jgi:hypothetical protein